VPARRRAFPTLRAVLALMLREMSTSYGRSPGGYAWAVAEPVLSVAFLSFVFAQVFRTPPIGLTFPMFYATGMVPFVMFNDLHNKVAQSLMYSRNLLAYPTVTFVDALLARFLTNLITHVMIAYLVLGGAMVLFEGPMNVDIVQVVLGLTLIASAALGIGTLNAYVFSRVPVMQQAWSVMMRPMFIFSCVLMTYDSIPMPFREWLWWNPILHGVGAVRGGFYDVYDAYYVTPWYVLAVALSCLTLGLLFLRAHHREILSNS
jgi:capsular polysaccharide transport system permease protein